MPSPAPGQAPAPATRREFRIQFQRRFYDPAFEAERAAIDRLEAIAWQAYKEGAQVRPSR
jgi:hypothetical protein